MSWLDNYDRSCAYLYCGKPSGKNFHCDKHFTHCEVCERNESNMVDDGISVCWDCLSEGYYKSFKKEKRRKYCSKNGTFLDRLRWLFTGE